MFYAFEQEVPIDEAMYRKIMERLGPEPLEGLVVHLVVRAGDDALRYIDVWTSKEAYARAVEARIHPAVSAVFREARFRPGHEPARTLIDVVDARVSPPAADGG
jgi:hypothetical protein